jgi:hypothetical protein
MSEAGGNQAADLAELVQHMQALKAEHRELLTLIGSDAGMAPETRRALLAHLMEEEDELVQRIAAATPGAGRAGKSAEPTDRPRLSVGSLRAEEPVASGRLGSLRRS